MVQQQDPDSTIPVVESQKRRRVTRLCDECRRKKVKCDGQQPCIHCTVYSYECTYNQPSSRRRLMNDSSGSGSNGRPHPHHHHPHHQQHHQQQFQDHQQDLSHPTDLHPTNEDSEDQSLKRLLQYETFVDKLFPDLKNINIFKLTNVLNQLKQDKKQVELQDIQNLYTLTTRTNNGIPYSHSPISSPSSSATPHQATALIDGSIESTVGKEIKIILPPKDIAVKLISSTWDNACVLFRFYHRPSFIKQLSILYETDPSNYTDTQQKFLPLVYSVMACGSLFYKSAQLTKNSQGQNKTEQDIFDDEGYRYFIAARKLIDITDTRDIYGIQTIVMLVLFLQCGARLSTCYSYVGIGLRAALREGFHRRLDYPFNPIQLEVRKRIFWTVFKMDIYVNTMLGLPFSISEKDFDQDLPIELDDENITEYGYNFDNQHSLSSSAIANSHTKLLMIMKKVVNQLYPVKKEQTLSHVSSNNIVYNLELELQNWVNDLPLELKPGLEPNLRYFKANRLLHFSYLHIKIILYRPFIHYISQDFQNSTNMDDLKSIEKLKNCINVARIVVKLSQDMISKNMLSGSYWFSIYTIFFSVACLVYYVHFGPGIIDDEFLLIKKDAENGKKVLEVLKNSSMAARRTFSILNSVFEQLNRKTAQKNGNQQQHQQGDPALQTKIPKIPNQPTNRVVNGVNFIDGIDTGINLNMSQPTPQQSVNSSIPHEQQINKDDDSKYLPGIIDKFDSKIFGKFLPPYMNADLNQVSKDLGQELLSNDQFSVQIPSGLSSTSNLLNEDESLNPAVNNGNNNVGSTDSSSTTTGVPTSDEYNFDELLNEWAHDGSDIYNSSK